MEPTTLLALMVQKGARRLFAKELAANDNSKQQVYLGGSLDVLNILPTGDLSLSASTSTKPSAAGRQTIKAPLAFSWLLDNGALSAAPGAQLILYPQYPEARFSGFLKRSPGAPSDLMTSRQPGRVLIFGVCDDGRIVGRVESAGSSVAGFFHQQVSDGAARMAGVLSELTLPDASPVMDSRRRLIEGLAPIVRKGWIDSYRLDSSGAAVVCDAPNCGGYTLEAELGVRPNGYSQPDFEGWEIKQYGVTSFVSRAAKVITLMTPEPTGGYYVEQGAIAFVRRFGYPDASDPSRINFGGVHTVGQPHRSTGLTLELPGFDATGKKLVDPSRGIELVASDGTVTASWAYTGLMEHWKRKHALAAYVPSLSQASPRRYQYGRDVLLGERTDFLHFLAAMASGKVIYDPGIKVTNAFTRSPVAKRRSQFRMKLPDLGMLYESSGRVDVLA